MKLEEKELTNKLRGMDFGHPGRNNASFYVSLITGNKYSVLDYSNIEELRGVFKIDKIFI